MIAAVYRWNDHPPPALQTVLWIRLVCNRGRRGFFIPAGMITEMRVVGFEGLGFEVCSPGSVSGSAVIHEQEAVQKQRISKKE